MENKLDFLRKYKKNVQLISFNQINELDSEAIPSTWFSLFKEADVNVRIEIILSIWKKYVGMELRNIYPNILKILN